MRGATSEMESVLSDRSLRVQQLGRPIQSAPQLHAQQSRRQKGRGLQSVVQLHVLPTSRPGTDTVAQRRGRQSQPLYAQGGQKIEENSQ